MKYNPITVTDLNKYIKEKISDDITQGIYILR